MRFSDIISVAVLAATEGLVAAQASGPVTGALGNATIVKNNPAGASFRAVLPDTAFTKTAYPNGGNVKGEVTAVTSPDGNGVVFTVRFSNLPKEGGPFPYHIHVAPVPSSGNCTETLAHLDPFVRGEDPVCDATLPQTCQVGDLSGKHGKITSDPFVATYTDPYVTTLEGLGSYFGNRSFVVHFANKTRITCANFAKTSGSLANSTTTAVVPTGTAPATSTTAKPSQSIVPFSAGVSMRYVNTGIGMLAFAGAVVFAL